MLHLPALQRNGYIDRISSNLSKLGLTLRGSYGEGTQAIGALYQISNQVTLGLSEKDAINNLKNVVLQLVEQERSARKILSKDVKVLDKINRSFGILLYSKVLSNEEFMNLISNVRLGVSIGEIQNLTYDTISSLIIDVQPATLMKNNGKEMLPFERDELRASIVRQKLFENK